MAGSQQDEIYSIMFASLKHPVRRKILRMLGNKSMTFMEMVEELGISSPNLTYHLESLGELISKMDNDKYKLSTFGLATINAMKGIEEVRETEPKRRNGIFKWKMFSAALLVTVLLLASFASLQYTSINELASAQQSLSAEVERLLKYGIGSTDKVSSFLKNVSKLDTTLYTIDLRDNTMQWRTDLGGVAEENMQYALTSTFSNLNIDFRIRNNHFSRYALDLVESAPIFSQTQPIDVLQNAKFTLARYKAYSGDDYLTQMSELLDTVSKIENTKVTQDNMEVQIITYGSTVVFLLMHTENDIDFQTKGLQMTYQNNILTTMTDGYFLYTVGNTNLAVSNEQAVEIAKSHVKTLTWNIEGQQVSGFSVVDTPLSVQMVPHTRGNTVALYPYWYIELRLNQIYAGGINVVTFGIYADTGQVADVQMRGTSSAETFVPP